MDVPHHHVQQGDFGQLLFGHKTDRLLLLGQDDRYIQNASVVADEQDRPVLRHIFKAYGRGGTSGNDPEEFDDHMYIAVTDSVTGLRRKTADDPGDRVHQQADHQDDE